MFRLKGTDLDEGLLDQLQVVLAHGAMKPREETSISSKNRIEGACSFALENTSRSFCTDPPVAADRTSLGVTG